MSSSTRRVNFSEWEEVDIKKVDYITDYEYGPNPVMHILGRTKGGTRVHIKNDETKPYFYVPKDEFDADIENHDRVTGYERGYEDIKGNQLVKVFTRIPGDVPVVRKGYDHYEADILFPNRFLVDESIEGSIRIPKKHATPEPTTIDLDNIKRADYETQSRICFCDIEVDDSKGFPDEEDAEREVISITVYDKYRDEYIIFLYHPELPIVNHEEAKVVVFEDEISMLQAFNDYLKRRDFDVIAGWNFTDFDSRYLVNRMERLSEETDRNIHKNDISDLGTAYDDGSYLGAKIRGISVFDLLEAYKNLQFSELDSFSLEDVAQEELDAGKIKDNRSLYEQWQEDPEQLVDYNVRDVKLTVMLDEQIDIIRFYEEIANFVGGRLAEVVNPSAAVDIKVLRSVNGKWPVPSSKNVESEDFEGGKVFDPITGVRDNVLVLDLKSLYPMSMKTINAGPDTKDPEGELEAPNGIRFSNDEDSVTVGIIDELLTEREKLKDIRNQYKPDSRQYNIYDIKQAAVKIVMNCFSSDTEVVTPDGIRNIKNLDVGDKVYSIDPETHELEIKPVVNTIKQNNQYGQLKHIQTSNTDFKITPNHRMLVSQAHRSKSNNTFISHYDELASGYTYQIPSHKHVEGEGVDTFDLKEFGVGRLWLDIDVHGNTFKSAISNSLSSQLKYDGNRRKYRIDDIDVYWDNKDIIDRFKNTLELQYSDKHSTIPSEYSMDKWLKLMGWYISEGCTHKVESKDSENNDKSYRGKSERIQIAQKQIEYTNDIEELVDSMGINYTRHSNGVDISNSILYEWFKKNCGEDSYSKRIPEWVFENNLSYNQYKQLLITLIRGDGQIQNNTKCRYSTVSDELKEDIVRLCVLCGFKPKVNKDSEGVWRIWISRDKGSFKKERTQTIEHDDYVYCVVVEDNHTLLAGRNGKFQWTGNTLYGVMGDNRFRLYDKETAAAVTSTGRGVISFTEAVTSEMGHDVIYGDTDSIMLELGPEVSKERAKQIGYEVEDKLNKLYDKYAKQKLNADEHFFKIEFEKLYRRFFQSGRKKRYAGHIIWKEGKDVDDLDIVGFETKRSDYSKIAKEIISDVLEAILHGGTLDDISQIVRSEINKLRNEEYDPDDWAIPSNISKEPDDYESMTMEARGVKYSNDVLDLEIQSSDKPKGMYFKRILPDESGEEPYPMPNISDSQDPYMCWMDYGNVPDNFVWDWDVYVEKQIKAPIQRILEGTNWTWAEVITGQRQPKLDEYAFEDEGDNNGHVASFTTEKDDTDDSPDFNEMKDWEVQEHEARQALAEAQQMLDGFDDIDDPDEDEVITLEATSSDGPATLDEFM